MENETKHTPGPWVVLETANLIHVGLDGRLTFGSFSPSDKGRANARLIAACPTMADYVIKKAVEGDKDAETIARSFGWSPER